MPHTYPDGQLVQLGDALRFDHFGTKDRRGVVVKLTPSAVHVQWTAPSSGATRVVKVSTTVRPSPAWFDHVAGVEVPARDCCDWTEKHPRLDARQEA